MLRPALAVIAILLALAGGAAQAQQGNVVNVLAAPLGETVRNDIPNIAPPWQTLSADDAGFGVLAKLSLSTSIAVGANAGPSSFAIDSRITAKGGCDLFTVPACNAVAGFFGAGAVPGTTSSIWGINTYVNLEAGVGTAAHQGAAAAEFDVNNANADYGLTYPTTYGARPLLVNVTSGLGTLPIRALGISVNGTAISDSTTATAGIMVAAATAHPLFHIGFWANNAYCCKDVAFADGSNATTSYQMTGVHTTGIDMHIANLSSSGVIFNANNLGAAGATATLYQDATALSYGSTYVTTNTLANTFALSFDKVDIKNGVLMINSAAGILYPSSDTTANASIAIGPGALAGQTTGVSSAVVAASGTGPFAPADTITLRGGVSNGTLGVLNVATTQVASATIVGAGTGGVNGACTVTGTTGTGTKFQASGTVTANALDTTIPLTIAVAGSYTVNPTTPTVEPVTGCSLTGATLNIAAGLVPATFTVNAAGVYSFQPANPVLEASSSGSGTGETVTVTWTAGAAYGNTAVGHSALSGTMTTAAVQNTAMGRLACGAVTSGNGNTCVGYSAASTLTTGSGGVYIGLVTVDATAASNAVAIGNAANTGSNGVSVGANAGLSLTASPSNQVFIGIDAGEFTTSLGDTFVGYLAGLGVTGAKLTGINNTAIGQQAGLALQGVAASNVLLGTIAGSAITTGSTNVCIGPTVCSTGPTTGANNIIIGTVTSGDPATSTSNTLWIGGGATAVLSSTLINATPATVINGTITMPGITQVGVNETYAICGVVTTIAIVRDTVTCIASLREHKERITTLQHGLDEVMALRPVEFYWRPEFSQDRRPQVGLIAEEAVAADPRLGAYSASDPTKLRSVKYEQMTAVLAAAIQELKHDNDNLHREIAELRNGTR